MQMELAVKERSARIETAIMRAAEPYGPAFLPVSRAALNAVGKDQSIFVGSSKVLRSMAYVDNICQGMLLAATTPRAAGETYWIADRRPYSPAEIAETIIKVEREFGSARAVRVRRIPAFASVVASRVDHFLQTLHWYSPQIHTMGELNKRAACSIKNAEQQLGYAPTIELEEGMRRILRAAIADDPAG